MKLEIGRGGFKFARETAPKIMGEQGSSNSKTSGAADLEAAFFGLKNPSIKQMQQMLDNDGTAQGLNNMIKFPVLASGWKIVPDPADVVITKDADGNDVETHPQADFVEAALRNPQHKGGMSTPFGVVLANIMRAVLEGYRFFELVYKFNDEGQIVFQKIAAREHNQVTLLEDETGGFAGVEQLVSKNGKTQKVVIDLQYCFLFTNLKERHPLKGASSFRAAYYHYDKKHRLYYLQHQQAQTGAMGIKVLTAPEGSEQADRDANLAVVDKMAVRPTAVFPDGWELEIKDMGKGIDLNPGLDGHDAQMARSVLLQGMLLGNQSSNSGGSYSLGETHMDAFMASEIDLMTSIEEHITSFLISKLIDFNFETKLYPTFKFNPLNDEVIKLLSEAFKGLVTKGAVPNWVAESINEKVAERLEIDKPVGEAVKPTDDDYVGNLGGGATPPTDGEATDNKLSRSKKKVTLDTNEYWRELTAAEAKVKFAKIEDQAKKTEEAMLDDLRPVFTKISDDAVSRLEPLLEDKGVEALDGFELKFTNELQKVISSHMLVQYSDAKKTAADEIKKSSPANKPASKALINEHAQGIVDKQVSDMIFNVKTIVTDAARKNLLDKTKAEFSVRTVLKTIIDMFDDFFDEKEPLTAAATTTFSITLGRDDVFQTYKDDIYAYQYSSILDGRECKICGEGGLDGSVVKPEVYYDTIWLPPIHHNCRCIWVAIMNDEEDKPDFKDIPAAPGGADAPSLSRTGRIAYT